MGYEDIVLGCVILGVFLFALAWGMLLPSLGFLWLIGVL